MIALLLGLAAMQGGDGGDVGYMGYESYTSYPGYGNHVGYNGYSTYGDYGGYGGYGGWGPPINYIRYKGHVIPASPPPLPMVQYGYVDIVPQHHGHHHDFSLADDAEDQPESGPASKREPQRFPPPPTEDKAEKFPPAPNEILDSGNGSTTRTAGGKGPLKGKALIIVSVPEDAKVMLNGQPTTATGKFRSYMTPDIQPGMKYAYTIRVEAKRNGESVTEQKRVEFAAGRYTFVNFERLK